MSTAPRLVRRAASMLLVALLCAAGTVVIGTPANATTDSGCPHTTFLDPLGGWIKYDGLTGTTYTYPQKPGYVVAGVCYKASTTTAYVTPTGTITSTVTNDNGEIKEISHASVLYLPRPIPPKPAPHVTEEPFTAQPTCEEPTVLVGVITITTDWVFDRASWTWVPGEPVAVDNRVPVSLTEAELAACQPKPEPVVTIVTFSTQPSCETPSVMLGDVVTTTDWIWDAGTSSWVPGEPVVVDNRVPVSLTEAELAACEPKPEPVVTIVTFSAQPSCESPTVMLGDVVTTTDWIWDAETSSWVPGEPSVVDNRVPAGLTLAQLADCEQPDPSKPDPVVSVLSFTAVPTCAAPSVLLGDVTTTTDWIWDAETETWVPGEPIVTDNRVAAALTPVQLAACAARQVTVVDAVRTVPTATARLAATGSPVLLQTLTGLAFVALGGLALLGRRRLRT
ncbi:hypothetical protein [Actinotalea fermentans]|uniref:Gram-positive cocci surface proteins LPxTG domain-containing protein n=1 Tax=Actinotalea fermentans TaxID=43671 RepID=A0A511YXL7_9CELL|nr:hypothetical protein [Actinotalea fermentans]GEN79945.1 hypothetical protein AFE02nite_16790 [Actinotalea fermentans]